MIPFVGAAAVWAPAALWLYFIDERTGAAIGLAVYGLAVVSSVDNLIKPFVLHGASRLHPLLALLSILGGVSALGAIGIIVGPMIVSFLQTLLNILHRELLHFDRESPDSSSATGGEQA
jgi:predicted PurR-regulated permease PerM